MSSEPNLRLSSAAVADRRLAVFLARRFVRARKQGLVSLISIISALGFLLGVASLIVVLALMTGFHASTFQHILDANAHIWVRPADLSAVNNSVATIARIEAVDGVSAAEPVVETLGFVIPRGGRVQPAAVHGIDPQRAGRVSRLDRSMVDGTLASLHRVRPDDRPKVIVGHSLAEQLGVGVGDVVTLMVPVPELMFSERLTLRRRALEVVGIFKTGYDEYDSSWVLTALDTVRDLLRLDGEAERIAVRAESVDSVPEVSARLHRELGTDWLIEDIYGHYTALFSALRLEKLALFLALGLIVLVAAFGVISTLVLTVMQKVRAIGVLTAMGATPRALMQVFVYQGATMGVVGTLGGAALGVSSAWALDRYQLIKLDPRIYLMDHLPFQIVWSDVVVTIAVALVVSLIATLYPAWRVARLDPVEALRHD